MDNDKFEDKIYSVEDKSFVEKLEHLNDFSIKFARKQIEEDGTVSKGCFKRIRSQLRFENELLTKSGRPIISWNLRRYVVQKYHEENDHFVTGKLYLSCAACQLTKCVFNRITCVCI